MQDPEAVSPYGSDMIWRIDTIGTEVRQLFGFEDMEQLSKGFPAKAGVTWMLLIHENKPTVFSKPHHSLYRPTTFLNRSCCCQSRWRVLVPLCIVVLFTIRDVVAAPLSAMTLPLRALLPAVTSLMLASTASIRTPGGATQTSTSQWMSRGCGPSTPPIRLREPS